MNNGKSLILADDKEQLTELGHQIKTLVPGADKLSTNQAISLGNASLISGANPFRGELYGYTDKNGVLKLVEGYKLLVRWAKRVSDYDDNYSERLPVGVEGIEEGDIGYRITITRHDKRAGIKEYIKLGATFKEALDLVSTDAVGIVLKKETWSSQYKKAIDPPKGWSWDQVARKRALKNGLNLAFAMPGIAELAKETWMVDDVQTVPQDWAGTENYQTDEEAERHAQLAAEERQRQVKVSTMDTEALTAYKDEIKAATDVMRNNGDDDPLDLADEMPDVMDPSTNFYAWGDANNISRPMAGEFLKETHGDFDAALKLMKEAQSEN